jgi:2'-5' RNA ligase
MMTSYADAREAWEDWMHAYRFGVLLLFPPEPVRSVVNRLRTRYDPRSQRYCDAHISLTVAATAPVTRTRWAELEAAAAQIEPFEITYGPLKHYLPHPGVCLAVEPFEALDALRAALEAVPPFSDAPARHYPFSPHMTIAEFITAERTVSLMTELAPVAPAGRFLCEGVSYAVPDGAFHFSERHRLTLGRNAVL